MCTRLLVIEGDHVEAHLGNYGDWRRRLRESTAAPVAPKEREKDKPKAPPPASDAGKDRTASKDRANPAMDAAWPRPRSQRASWCTA